MNNLVFYKRSKFNIDEIRNCCEFMTHEMNALLDLRVMFYVVLIVATMEAFLSGYSITPTLFSDLNFRVLAIPVECVVITKWPTKFYSILPVECILCAI